MVVLPYLGQPRLLAVLFHVIQLVMTIKAGSCTLLSPGDRGGK